MNHMEYVDKIAQEDAEGLRRAEQEYGSSWKLRGGIGAYMMMARKWDRLENRCKQKPLLAVVSVATMGKPEAKMPTQEGDRYDIFAHIEADQRSEGILDDIRDLRRYLMLVEAEMRARGVDAAHRDNQS